MLLKNRSYVQDYKNFTLIRENRKTIDRDKLPDVLYHVTTAYKDVLRDGVLRAKSGLDSGGLGGTESTGVSFVTDIIVAQNIENELILINRINSSSNEKELTDILKSIPDKERREFIMEQYNRTIDVYKDPKLSALMALRLSRISLKFSHCHFQGIVIFNEKNIKDKDIGIIEVKTEKIPKNVTIIEGVDINLGEIRVLGDVEL
jgi:hypothetical protein